MYHIKMGVNISSKAKNEFVTNKLIPFLEVVVQENYYFTRGISVIPVIDLFIKTTEERMTYIYSKLQQLFDQFVESLDETDIQENIFYVNNQRNIRKVNGYKVRRNIDNLAIDYMKIDTIERYGEYNHTGDKEIYTEYFFACQHLLERSIKYLYCKEEEHQLLLLFGMFYCASKQLDKTGIGRGYLSFKSHLLGFLNYKHKDMYQYKVIFEKKYEELENVLKEMIKCLEGQKVSWDSAMLYKEMIELIRLWEDLFAQLYDRLLQEELTSENAKKNKIKLWIQHMKFRKLSDFHNKVFSNKNRSFFEQDEFQAYRMLVNFVYLLLPAMGLSSRKRVEASYFLVSALEK